MKVEHMSDPIGELVKRYKAAMHGVQTAVALEIETLGLNGAGADAKHLRVGVNSALVDQSAIARLLIARGVFSELEYYEALATAAEAELARFHEHHPGITFR